MSDKPGDLMADVFVISIDDAAKAWSGAAAYEGYALETVLDSVREGVHAESLRRYYPEGRCYIWAIPDHRENRATWDLIHENDLMLAYCDGSIIAASYVFLTTDDPRLAEALWGDMAEGMSQLMCFCDKPHTGEVPLIPQMERYLDRNFTGFTRLDQEKCRNIMSDYGSFEVFVRLGLKYDFPFSFRHSE
jgi:hypothetical protein